MGFFWLFFLTFFFWPCIYETGRDYHGQHGWLPKPLRHTIRYSGGWKLGSGKVVDSSAGWSKMTFFGEQKGFLKFLCHFYNWVVGKFFLLTNPFGFFKKFFTHQVCVFKIKKSMFFYWISNGAPLMRVVLWILQKSIQLKYICILISQLHVLVDTGSSNFAVASAPHDLINTYYRTNEWVFKGSCRDQGCSYSFNKNKKNDFFHHEKRKNTFF